MSRILKVAFCVLTLFTAATLVGCGDKAKTDKPADSSTSTPAESTEKGSDAK